MKSGLRLTRAVFDCAGEKKQLAAVHQYIVLRQEKHTLVRACLDPNGPPKIPVRWHGTGACHDLFIPET